MITVAGNLKSKTGNLKSDNGVIVIQEAAPKGLPGRTRPSTLNGGCFESIWLDLFSGADMISIQLTLPLSGASNRQSRP